MSAEPQRYVNSAATARPPARMYVVERMTRAEQGPRKKFAEDEALWSRLMAEAQRGDEQSYRRLLESVGEAIAVYLRVHFGALDFLEDCVQECLLAVHQGRHTYDPKRLFRPWLFAIVRNKAIDMLRRRAHRPLDTSGIINMESSAALENLHYSADTQAEELSQQTEFFRGLTPKFRQALVLTKILGLSAREAAERIGVSEAAMKVRVHRAIQTLRKQLEM